MSGEREIHQQISGNVTGNVIQAHSVGTIINNAPERTVSLADEIPSSIEHYINYTQQLDVRTRMTELGLPV